MNGGHLCFIKYPTYLSSSFFGCLLTGFFSPLLGSVRLIGLVKPSYSVGITKKTICGGGMEERLADQGFHINS